MRVKPRRALRPGNTGRTCACNGWQPLRRYATARAHFHHAAATGGASDVFAGLGEKGAQAAAASATPVQAQRVAAE